MVDQQTWRACMASEIFREYVTDELRREASEQAQAQLNKQSEIEQRIRDEQQTWQQLEALKVAVANSPALKAKLVQAKAALAEHPELAAQVDANFIEGLKLLDLE